MRAPPATFDEALAFLRGYDLGRDLPRCEEDCAVVDRGGGR
ncbi:MAG: hypothetical protein R3A52_13495 [Polyangiales bacterium]